MGTIELRADLQAELQKDAEREARSVSDIVNDAVELYLHEQRRAQLQGEITAYEAMHPDLKRTRLGQWVAVYEGKLVDHDGDASALHRRVRATYGRATLLIREVTEEASPEIWMRTWSRGKIER